MRSDVRIALWQSRVLISENNDDDDNVNDNDDDDDDDNDDDDDDDDDDNDGDIVGNVDDNTNMNRGLM